MPRLQRAHLSPDAEQFADDLLERGRERDDQIGFVLAGNLLRRAHYRVAALAARFARQRGPRRHQPTVQLRTARREDVDEGAVETDQSVTAVKIVECQPEA